MADDLRTIYGIIMGLMLFGVIIALGVQFMGNITIKGGDTYSDVNDSYLTTFSTADYTKFQDNMTATSESMTDSLMNVSPGINSVDSVKISTWGAIKATLSSPLYIKDAITSINDNGIVGIPIEIVTWVMVAFLLLIAMIIIAILWYR